MHYENNEPLTSQPELEDKTPINMEEREERKNMILGKLNLMINPLHDAKIRCGIKTLGVTGVIPLKGAVLHFYRVQATWNLKHHKLDRNTVNWHTHTLQVTADFKLIQNTIIYICKI